MIDRWLKRAWKKAVMSGHYPGIVPSLTRNRKVITTDVRRRKRDSAEDVASMLCHKKTTADRHYDLVEQVQRSQSTYTELYGENKRTTPSITFTARTEEEQSQLAHDMVKRCCVKLTRLTKQQLTKYKIAEPDEDMENLKRAMEDFDFYKRQVEEGDEEDTVPPSPTSTKSSRFVGIWPSKKEKLFWTEE